MPYSAEISQANPTCLLFLIDQSGSMREPIAGGGGMSKAEAAALPVNDLLYQLSLSCVWGTRIVDRIFVGVLGYGQTVGSAFAGILAQREGVPIGEVARHPLRVEERRVAGGSSLVKAPVWVEPAAEGSRPMCAALQHARALLASFLQEHPDCFPPVVINVSDGQATDGDPEGPAADLRQLASSDGEVLLFNAFLSSRPDSAMAMLPAAENDLAGAHARVLFRMSSPLPPLMQEQAGAPSGVVPRGFVFNADLTALAQFTALCAPRLRSGTRVRDENVQASRPPEELSRLHLHRQTIGSSTETATHGPMKEHASKAERSLDAPAGGQEKEKGASDSSDEFQLRPDEKASPGTTDKHILDDPDFDVPALDDSGSQELVPGEADTDLEDSEYDFSLDEELAASKKGGSQVVVPDKKDATDAKEAAVVSEKEEEASESIAQPKKQEGREWLVALVVSLLGAGVFFALLWFLRR
jgi:hypothetical protein